MKCTHKQFTLTMQITWEVHVNELQLVLYLCEESRLQVEQVNERQFTSHSVT